MLLPAAQGVLGVLSLWQSWQIYRFGTTLSDISSGFQMSRRVALIVCFKCRSSLAKLVNWKYLKQAVENRTRHWNCNCKLELETRETKVTGTGTETGPGTERDCDWDCNWDWAGASPKRSWERLCNPLLSAWVRAGWHEGNAMIDR